MRWCEYFLSRTGNHPATSIHPLKFQLGRKVLADWRGCRHLKYTIPPAVLLTILYRPLFTKLDAYKIGFLITVSIHHVTGRTTGRPHYLHVWGFANELFLQVAVLSTIPWDSYLIRNNIWSYPSHAVIGWKLCDIPLEEVFFFVIQTYITSLLYLILSKPTYQPIYLRADDRLADAGRKAASRWRYYRIAGQVAFAALIGWSWHMVTDTSLATYTGLILIWSMPFVLFLW